MSNQQNPFPGDKPAGQQGPKKGPKFSLSWVYGIIALALAFLYINGGSATEGTTRRISYSEFKEYVAKGYGKQAMDWIKKEIKSNTAQKKPQTGIYKLLITILSPYLSI